MSSYQRHWLEEVKDGVKEFGWREKKDDIPPMSSVRLPGGRLRTTSWRPEEPSWNAYESDLVSIEGACSLGMPFWVPIEFGTRIQECMRRSFLFATVGAEGYEKT